MGDDSARRGYCRSRHPRCHRHPYSPSRLYHFFHSNRPFFHYLHHQINDCKQCVPIIFIRQTNKRTLARSSSIFVPSAAATAAAIDHHHRREGCLTASGGLPIKRVARPNTCNCPRDGSKKNASAIYFAKPKEHLSDTWSRQKKMLG